MTVRKKILLLYGISFLFFLILILSTNYFNNKREKIYLEEQKLRLQKSSETALNLTNEYYQTLTIDYTFWDEFVYFIEGKDENWANEILLPLIDTYGLDYIWSFDLNYNLKSYYQKAECDTLIQPIEKNIFYNYFDTIQNGTKRLVSFYLKHNNKYLVVFGATIHTSNDQNRIEKPNGFFFVAKTIDSTYVEKLALITDCKILLNNNLTEDIKFKNIASTKLLNLKLDTIGEITFEKDDNFLKEDKKYKQISLIIYIIIIILILINAIIFITKYVSNPLNIIQKSLHLDSPKFIQNLSKNKDEFGEISTLILLFFQQKQNLKNEIEERKVIEEQLKEGLEELRQKNEEINAQAEELENINEELEKLSIVANKTENSVIIANAKKQIEFVNEGFLKLYEININNWMLIENKNLILLSQNPEIENLIEECKNTKQTIFYTILNKTFKNNNKWIQTTLTPTFDFYGVLEYYIFVEADVTNIKLAEQKINEQNKNIKYSIQYARRIQNALYPPIRILEQHFKEYFIFYRPKHTISGDFYWIAEKNNQIYFAVADCTGHGVPGAFMSVLSISLLNDIVINSTKKHTASDILELLREKIIISLHQNDAETKSNDGLDISFLIIENDKTSLQFSGAHNPLFIISNNELIEVEADLIPISNSIKMKKFTTKLINININDNFYMLSDGYTDQFGGEIERKYTKKRLRNLFLQMYNNNFKEQEIIITEEFDKWKGNVAQLDDVLVFGFKF